MSEMSEAIAISRPETTSEERTWAALAHLSTVLTLLVSLGTAGIGGLFLVFVPFVIYLIYKDKSRFVSFQAAQAFALQVVGTVGYFAMIVLGAALLIVAWVITGVLSAILIGIILIPVALVLTLAYVLLLVAAPFVLGGYSIAAAVESGGGANYYYPYLGQWVSEWLSRQNNEVAPAV